MEAHRPRPVAGRTSPDDCARPCPRRQCPQHTGGDSCRRPCQRLQAVRVRRRTRRNVSPTTVATLLVPPGPWASGRGTGRCHLPCVCTERMSNSGLITVHCSDRSLFRPFIVPKSPAAVQRRRSNPTALVAPARHFGAKSLVRRPGFGDARVCRRSPGARSLVGARR